MAIQPEKRERDNLRRLLGLARAEDLGGGDVTSTILPEGVAVCGRFVARAELVFCGGAFLAEIAAAYDEDIQTKVLAAEGARVEVGAVLAEWVGPARPILAAERVALNFLQRLCGVATTTREYVDAVAGTGATIYDTRKTTPGWRALAKYAVRAGGGENHRMGLHDAALVKDNHLAILAGDGLTALAGELTRLRSSLPPGGFIEVEVDTLEQFACALELDIDVIMLDNMSIEQLAEAVRLRNQSAAAGRIKLEASGRITLENVRAVAEVGVEQIAVGALTHSAAAADISLEIETA